MRNQVLPLLSELLGGDAVPAIAATADRIAADQALIASLTDLAPTTSCAELADDAGPVRRRRLAAWLLGQGVPVQGDQLDAVEALVVDWHGQWPVAVAGGRAVVRRQGKLTIVD